LPAPVVPLRKLDLGEVQLSERARHRADGKSLGPCGERHELRPLHEQARQESFDLTMWFGESLRCRLGATGWLFSLDLQHIHGICVPSVLFCGPPCANRRFCFRQKARVISATSLLISSANAVAVKLFSRARCRLVPRGKEGNGGDAGSAALTLVCCSSLACHESNEEAVSAVAQGRHQKGLLQAVGR